MPTTEKPRAKNNYKDQATKESKSLNNLRHPNHDQERDANKLTKLAVDLRIQSTYNDQTNIHTHSECSISTRHAWDMHTAPHLPDILNDVNLTLLEFDSHDILPVTLSWADIHTDHR